MIAEQHHACMPWMHAYRYAMHPEVQAIQYNIAIACSGCIAGGPDQQTSTHIGHGGTGININTNTAQRSGGCHVVSICQVCMYVCISKKCYRYVPCVMLYVCIWDVPCMYVPCAMYVCMCHVPWMRQRTWLNVYARLSLSLPVHGDNGTAVKTSSSALNE